MAGLIEDYALIGDMQTAALVGRDGSVDWLCLPRFDSPACFTRLLGTEEHGCWRICPASVAGEPAAAGGRPAAGGPPGPARRYHGDSLILYTEWRTATGTVRVIDFMPPRDGRPPVLGASEVDGLSGSEGAFLACSFWLVNALQQIGREDQAIELLERLLGLRNDVGLLSEEYDPRYRRLIGNIPQAFSHVPLIQAALNLAAHEPDHCRRPGGRVARGHGQR